METGAKAGKRILVVDDDPIIRQIFTQVLRLEGHSVIEAGDGAEALSLFSKHAFDLVITDYEMPLMKGDELAAKIRDLVPSQRIIMVSGTWPKLAEPVRNVDFCLGKPFEMAELIMAVRRVLQGDQETGPVHLHANQQRPGLSEG